MKEKLTKETVGIFARSFLALGRMFSALSALDHPRRTLEGDIEYLLTLGFISTGFKRKLKEHQINSSILKESIESYFTSLDQLYEGLKAEILDEGIANEQDNMYLRPPRAMEQGEVPAPREERPGQGFIIADEAGRLRFDPDRVRRPARPRNNRGGGIF